MNDPTSTANPYFCTTAVDDSTAAMNWNEHWWIRVPCDAPNTLRLLDVECSEYCPKHARPISGNTSATTSGRKQIDLSSRLTMTPARAMILNASGDLNREVCGVCGEGGVKIHNTWYRHMVPPRTRQDPQHTVLPRARQDPQHMATYHHGHVKIHNTRYL